MENNMVNHPSHYQTEDGIECIDAIAAAVHNLKGMEAFDTGTCIKYLWRWKKKNGIEDLDKARWYLSDLIYRLNKNDEFAKNVLNKNQTKDKSTQEKHANSDDNKTQNIEDLIKDTQSDDDISIELEYLQETADDSNQLFAVIKNKKTGKILFKVPYSITPTYVPPTIYKDGPYYKRTEITCDTSINSSTSKK